jgi:hypothetical protein
MENGVVADWYSIEAHGKAALYAAGIRVPIRKYLSS